MRSKTVSAAQWLHVIYVDAFSGHFYAVLPFVARRLVAHFI